MGAGEGSGGPSRVTSAFGSLSGIVGGGSPGAWRWDRPAGGAGRGAGSRASRLPVGLSRCVRGIGVPKRPLAQMGQSKQDGVKLSAEQPALVYIKAAVFKNRNKIPLPSRAFAIPPALFVWLACPRAHFGAGGQRPARGDHAEQVAERVHCVPVRGDYTLRAVPAGAERRRAGHCGVAEPWADLPCASWGDGERGLLAPSSAKTARGEPLAPANEAVPGRAARCGVPAESSGGNWPRAGSERSCLGLGAEEPLCLPSLSLLLPAKQ